jgi:2-C-methyl-D-erythritol 4-phosphate cytidylyltransferase
MKKWAIIVAGGSGLRMGQALPKQFLSLADRPLLHYTIDAFLQAYEDICIVLVLPKDFMEMGGQLISSSFAGKSIQLTSGGSTRFDSVKNGLALTDREAIIFVHDGVRCLVTPPLIRRCYDKALEAGAVVPVVSSKDSIRLRGVETKEVESSNNVGGAVSADRTMVLDRDRVLLVQTPQTFFGDWLHEAFKQPYQPHFTDEATVVEQAGRSISLVEGEETNIKITRPIDLLIAEQYLQQRTTT